MSREPASCTTALTYYWRSALWLAPGEIIQPGNWGKVILAFGARHPRFYAEYLFERIRQAEFAARPSRMRAAFAFRDEAVARAFDNAGAPLLYRVQSGADGHTATVDILDRQHRRGAYLR